MNDQVYSPTRTLMGPGPSDVHPRVLQAMASPVIGHLDPVFLQIMNGTMDMLRKVFGTENQLTVPMSGTGSSGMETLFVNLIEPGDKVVIGVNGLFGQRMVDVAARVGAEVIQVTAPWGQPLDPAEIEQALKQHGQVKAVGVVHAETSTGVRQPLEPIGELAHRYGALFLVDAVTSLGGIPVEVDRVGIDACYSGTQKCLSVPPGLSPVTFNQEAVKVLGERKGIVQSWYLDLTMIQRYWGAERFYHHTAPISMIYALREGLALILEEGLEQVYARHRLNGEALQAGLIGMGLKLLVDEQYRLPELTSVLVPEEVQDVEVRKRLLQLYNIEIGGGLGELKGKIWRVGLMGHTCRRRNVLTFLSALEDILIQLGYRTENGSGIREALRVYQAAGGVTI
ncbi:alanine--glyoxylate aminotransferase [Clostridiales bacterium PH28_bin88]|nr:alanine--glyoxylate aminotransferase [Clostridiales bacterium PH28_bin88]